MVKQTITFSDGTETVINYRGVIVDGVLISEKVDMDDEKQVEETVEEVTPAVPTPEPASEEVAEDAE